MASYTLKRSTRLKAENNSSLNIDYYLIEEFCMRENSNLFGIRVSTNDAFFGTDDCEIESITSDINEALYVIDKMADNGVTSACASDVINDLMF